MLLPGIDFHGIAFVDEEGNHEFVTVVDFSRFENVGGSGIAAGTGFSFGDDFFNESGESDVDDLAIEEEPLAKRFFDEEVCAFAESFSGNVCFFISFSIAEYIVVAILIRIVHFPFFQVGFFHFINGAESTVHGAAGDEVFQFAAVESSTFTGFAEFKFCNGIGFAVDFDFKTFFQVCS